MAQTLILPINNTKLTASWKTGAYRQRFGFEHYGVDMVSSAGQTLVYSSGEGSVLAAGADSVLGNIVVVRYTDALNRADGKSGDVICRMFHFERLSVTKGQRVTKDTPLGYYGNTGQLTTGAHLHLEMDRDTAYPFYTPTLSGVSTFFKGSRSGATDSTMGNPIEWLHCKFGPPDNQSYHTAGDAYIRLEDITIDSIR